MTHLEAIARETGISLSSVTTTATLPREVLSALAASSFIETTGSGLVSHD